MIPRLNASIGPSTVRVELYRGASLRWRAEADWTDPADLAEALAHLAGECALPRLFRTLHVRVDPSVIQMRRLEGLPKVGASGLRAMVALAPTRYFRRTGAPPVVDACWEGRRGRQVAVVAAIPHDFAAAIVRGARAAGFTLAWIRPLATGAAGRLQLLPPEEEVRRDARALIWTRRLGLVACVAWAILGVALVWRQIAERRASDARLTELQAPLDALLASKAAADSANAMVAQLDADAASKGVAVTTLFRIAAALPDSAFLTQVRIDSAGVGLVAGAAQRPASVLASLEHEGGVPDPRFAGRTTPDLVRGRPVERFAIDFGTREVHP